MAEVACPTCSETDDLAGVRSDRGIELTCGSCGNRWVRDDESVCANCGGEDLQTVPLAIVQRSRGTQLSILGTRPVSLCSVCDAEALAHYHKHRPSPLMPTDLPTVGEEQMKR